MSTFNQKFVSILKLGILPGVRIAVDTRKFLEIILFQNPNPMPGARV